MFFWHLGVPWTLTASINLNLTEEEQARIPINNLRFGDVFMDRRHGSRRVIVYFPRTYLSETHPSVSLLFLSELQMAPAA
jgi:hypothetical protein